jgi:hypothetical protein
VSRHRGSTRGTLTHSARPRVHVGRRSACEVGGDGPCR